MIILGLNRLEGFTGEFFRDESACLVKDGEVIAACAEERFTRNKHHAGFPWGTINYFFKDFDLSLEDIDYVATSWPRQDRRPKSESKLPFKLPVEKIETVGVGHELSHASSTYRSSGWKKSLILSMDAMGIDYFKNRKVLSSGGVFIGKGGDINPINFFPLQASMGMFYGIVTSAIGFLFGDGEGKTMGLAGYGNANLAYKGLKKIAPCVEGLKLKPKKNLAKWVTWNYNNAYRVLPEIGYVSMLVERHGRRNVAAAAQRILEEVISELVQNMVDEFGLKKICLAGGVFLNVKVNKRVLELENIKDIFIYPNPGDGGACVGAALEAYNNLHGKKKNGELRDVYLGPEYSNREIEGLLKRKDFEYEHVGDIPEKVAELISKGKVVGWFQGRMEWGPRALGARSVVADSTDPKVKDRINRVLKKRYWFMPFAPSILAKAVGEYFVDPYPSPFMILAFDVKEKKQKEIPAVMHIDGTARPHTVERKVNPKYYELIKCFEDICGVPIILNTSFNLHGLPIILDPSDALWHLERKAIDVLAIEDYIVKRKR